MITIEDEGEWWFDPCFSPPVAVLEHDGMATIVDREGRVVMYDSRAIGFVRTLAEVMNENAERLKKAWEQSAKIAWLQRKDEISI